MRNSGSTLVVVLWVFLTGHFGRLTPWIRHWVQYFSIFHVYKQLQKWYKNFGYQAFLVAHLWIFLYLWLHYSRSILVHNNVFKLMLIFIRVYIPKYAKLENIESSLLYAKISIFDKTVWKTGSQSALLHRYLWKANYS